MGRLNTLTDPADSLIDRQESLSPSSNWWKDSDGDGIPDRYDDTPYGDNTSSPETTQTTEATQPAETTQATEATQPVETTQATEPTQPAETTQATEATQPVETTQATEPTKPVETTQATEPTKPTSTESAAPASSSPTNSSSSDPSPSITPGTTPTEAGKAIETGNGAEATTGADDNTAGTIQDTTPFLSGTTLLYGGLALLAALVVCLIWLVLYQRKALLRAGRKRRNPVTVPATGATATMAADVEKTAADPMAAAIPIAARQPIVAAAHQHIGAREDQQDSFGTSDLAAYPVRGVLAVVADGMGGLSNGGAVSSALVRSFLDSFLRLGSHAQPQDMLLEMTIQANAYITQMLRGTERSGSTLVSAVIRDGYLHFLTVGDSRIYLYRSGALLQLNREHIYQEELAVKAANRLISIPQVSGDRQAHSLTSYFGNGQIAALDRNYEGIKLLSGDRILLASDGVFGTLSQTQMEQALHGTVTEAAAEIGELIRDANQPYQDNNTALILEYRG